MYLTNEQSDYYLSVLKIIAPKVTGKLGYAVARNMRNLSNSLTEYIERKNSLIIKYGAEINGEISLNKSDENYKLFLNEIKEFSDIEHDIDIMKVAPNDIYNSTLSADVISNIMFMIDEGDTNG